MEQKAGKQISCLFRQKETRHNMSAESQPAKIFIHKETDGVLATGGICVMIYTKMTKKAMKIAYDAHEGQTDKGEMPYIFHPYHLAEQMNTEETVITALLHDIIEDTPLTVAWLREQGFSEPVLEALTLLTHKKTMPYMEYIRRLRNNEIAYQVKLEDLKHNLDSSRLDTLDGKDKKRLEKYQEAISYLEQEKTP